MEDNNLGLFQGLLDKDLGDLAQEKKPTEESTSAAIPAEVNNKNKNEEKLPVDKTRIVCYAGHKIFIEDRVLSLEQIRKKLEKEFPELSKGRTEMAYDEKTGVVVPIIKAKKNGGILL